jgi:multidrug efflux pump subunit AcrA (membrane-fusion protein)
MLRTSHIVVVIVVFGAGFCAWSAATAEYPPCRTGGGTEEFVFPVRTAVVQRHTLVHYLPVSGRMRAIRRLEIMARTEGDAGGVLVSYGKHVRAGDDMPIPASSDVVLAEIAGRCNAVVT